MASSMIVSSAATVARAKASPVQASLTSSTSFSFNRRAKTNLPSNGFKVRCMKVWPIEGKKKFETLSYLPELTEEQLLRQIDYLLRNNWVPCLEFCPEGFVRRLYHASPGYYDGRYWTMWKLPMFGCNDATQVAKELQECKKEYPHCFVRIIGFDSYRQVQCVSFIAIKPPYKG